MRTLILQLQYDGSVFHGYQKQNNTDKTIETQLENATWAISKNIFQSKDLINFQAAGRTDKGVHALGQIVSLNIPEGCQKEAYAWKKGLNHFLSPSIRVHQAQIISRAFHARFEAHAREYIYVFETCEHIFLDKKVSFLKKPVDFELLEQAAQIFLGRHNFQSFQGGSCQAHSPIKTLYHSFWSTQGTKLIYHVKGCGFLHHMVRYLVACQIQVATKEKSLSWLKSLLEKKLPHHFCAPSDGLYFVQAFYENFSFKDQITHPFIELKSI